MKLGFLLDLKIESRLGEKGEMWGTYGVVIVLEVGEKEILAAAMAMDCGDDQLQSLSKLV